MPIETANTQTPAPAITRTERPGGEVIATTERRVSFSFKREAASFLDREVQVLAYPEKDEYGTPPRVRFNAALYSREEVNTLIAALNDAADTVWPLEVSA